MTFSPYYYQCVDPDTDGTPCTMDECRLNLTRDLEDHHVSQLPNGYRTTTVARCCLERCLAHIKIEE